MKCFLIVPTGFADVSLRRWHSSNVKCSIARFGYHEAMNAIGDVACRLEPWQGDPQRLVWRYDDEPEPSHDDPRWPTQCACGYAFSEADSWQVFHDQIYARADGVPQRILERSIPPGAMWWSSVGLCHHEPRCEAHLHVICPDGGEWDIDSRCSNCDRPDDRTHRCWVRHGEPPLITVDKAGNTCTAGAGSIMTRSGYHGFLRNGEFT